MPIRGMRRGGRVEPGDPRGRLRGCPVVTPIRSTSLLQARIILTTLCTVFATGCESPTGLRTGLTPAEIVMGTGDDSFIVVALANRRVHVSFTSYGGGCERLHEVRSAIGAMTALVEPINRYSVPESNVCTRELRTYHNQMVLHFNAPGPATVRLRGRNGGSFERPETLTLEKVVVLE